MRIKYSTYLALECLYLMLLFLFNFERYERDESTRAAAAGGAAVADTQLARVYSVFA